MTKTTVIGSLDVRVDVDVKFTVFFDDTFDIVIFFIVVVIVHFAIDITIYDYVHISISIAKAEVAIFALYIRLSIVKLVVARR